MKQKIALVALTFALTISAGSGLTQAQTATGTTSTNASATTASTSYWQQFWDWFGNFTGASATPLDDDGGNCPLRICTQDPED